MCAVCLEVRIELFVAPSSCVHSASMLNELQLTLTIKCNCCTIDVVISIDIAISFFPSIPVPFQSDAWKKKSYNGKSYLGIHSRANIVLHSLFLCNFSMCPFTTHICTLGERQRAHETHTYVLSPNTKAHTYTRINTESIHIHGTYIRFAPPTHNIHQYISLDL